jgi:DNA-binding transcriptional regulator YiaG
MSKQKPKARKYRSRLSGAIHETAAGLHRVGLMDKTTMREFDRPKRRSRLSLRSTRAT